MMGIIYRRMTTTMKTITGYTEGMMIALITLCIILGSLQAITLNILVEKSQLVIPIPVLIAMPITLMGTTTSLAAVSPAPLVPIVQLMTIKSSFVHLVATATLSGPPLASNVQGTSNIHSS